MNKRNGINRLGVKASHRKAIHCNMTISVFRHGRVQTTLSKAKAVRRTVEKLITRAKVDSVHNRREVAKLIHDKDILNKLFTEIAPEFAQRGGGYTRVIKTGLRRHDSAELALIELVGHGLEEPESKKKTGRRAKSAKPAASVAAEENPVAEQAPTVEVTTETPEAEQATNAATPSAEAEAAPETTTEVPAEEAVSEKSEKPDSTPEETEEK